MKKNFCGIYPTRMGADQHDILKNDKSIIYKEHILFDDFKKYIPLTLNKKTKIVRLIISLLYIPWAIKKINKYEKECIFLFNSQPPLIDIFLWFFLKPRKVKYKTLINDNYLKYFQVKKIYIYRIIKFLRINELFKRYHNSSIETTCLSSDMKNELINQGIQKSKIKKCSIFKYYDLHKAKYFQLNSNYYNEKNILNIIYTGSLSGVHSKELLFLAANNKNFKLTTNVATFLKIKKNLKSNTINICEKYSSFKDYIRNLSSFDLGLISLKDNCQYVSYPSKIVAYIISEIPVAYCGPSCDLSKLILENEIGLVSTNPADLIDEINILKSDSKKLIHLKNKISILKSNIISNTNLIL